MYNGLDLWMDRWIRKAYQTINELAVVNEDDYENENEIDSCLDFEVRMRMSMILVW